MSHNQKTIIGVLGLPIRKQENGWEFFLTKRYSPQKPIFHNKWQLAGGGMEFGETPEQTLVREFQEELCVTPKILYPQPIVMTNLWHQGIDDFSCDVHILLLTYLVSLEKQLPKINDPDEETSEFGWFTYQNVLTLDVLPKTVEFVEEALKIRVPYNPSETHEAYLKM